MIPNTLVARLNQTPGLHSDMLLLPDPKTTQEWVAFESDGTLTCFKYDDLRSITYSKGETEKTTTLTLVFSPARSVVITGSPTLMEEFIFLLRHRFLMAACVGKDAKHEVCTIFISDL